MKRYACVALLLVNSISAFGADSNCQANDAATDSISSNLLQTAIGVTPSGIAIPALVHREDFDFSTKKTRVLLVGSSAKDARSIMDALRWFYAANNAANYRKTFVLSAVPNAFPEPERLATRSYPPAGTAYSDPNAMESIYLWRWIGMHAPDLVVDVQSGSSMSWFIPPQRSLAKSNVRSKLSALTDVRTDELVTALGKRAPCETGLIDALRVNVAEGKSSFLPDLLAALSETKNLGWSPARREIQRRLARSPIQVAEQLSEHYGHELNQVVYIPAVALIGRLRLGELTKDQKHIADVRQIVARYFDGKKTTKPNSGSGLSGHLIFSELAARYEGDERQRFLQLARNAADLAFDGKGGLNSSMPFHSEMSDALFMGGPILAHVGQLTGEERYFDACVNHLRFMRKLVLRSDGLYRHSPLDETAWGRGNGFPALALALCLSHWPKERNDRTELLEMLQQHANALAAHQDPNGCWHQVIDRPESYRELSSTCMITFALARGVRNGWLDRKKFRPVIDKAWYAIRTRVGSDGRLVDVCTGTGKQKSLRAYYDRAAILGPDSRGGAMAMLAATEIAALLESEVDSD